MNIRTTKRKIIPQYYLILAILLLITPIVKAQDLDSIKPDSINKERKAIKILAVPLTMTMLGLTTVMAENHTELSKYSLQESFQDQPYLINTSIEDHFRNVPIALVYGLNLIGVKGKNKFVERTILLAKSLLIQHVLVSTMKKSFNIERPNGGNFSFPSSHTSRAFAAATFMHYEYKDISPWYSIGAYSVAVATGALRMGNNHHWFPDVLVGAGIGILSTNIAYHTHQYKWSKRRAQKEEKKNALVILPTYSQKSAGLYLSYKF